MSLELANKHVTQFLSTNTPEVLAIRGSWGVGKTYTWQYLLQRSKDDGVIKFKKYAYISLFGIETIEAFKYQIFEQTVGMNMLGEKPSVKSLQSNSDDLAKSLGRKSLRFLEYVPVIGKYSPAIHSASYLSVTDTIICIDDFERKSKLLTTRELLGVVLQLKEQKHCKIVLIFNDNEMDKKAYEEYARFREKVIDHELEFQPTTSECIDISLESDTNLNNLLKLYIGKLDICNIRVINKIRNSASMIQSKLTQFDEGVLEKALHALCLYTNCFYNSAGEVPDFSYVVEKGLTFYGVDGNPEKTDQQKMWDSMLRDYEYHHRDEFTHVIADFVSNGYLDEEELLNRAADLNQEIVAQNSEASFTEAWESFHHSFDDNEEEVVSSLLNSFKKNARYISRLNFNGTVVLFRDLGHTDLADKLIDIYIDAHKGREQIFDLKKYSFRGDITDEKIRNRFSTIANKNNTVVTLKEVLEKISKYDGWGREDEEILSNTTEDEFYQLFKGERGRHLIAYVDCCLQFGRLVNSSEAQRNISKNASSALHRIAQENTLNRLRVSKFDVDTD